MKPKTTIRTDKNDKPGGNMTAIVSIILVGWALLLTIIFSYASSVIGSSWPPGHLHRTWNTASSRRWWRAARWTGWTFDNAEDILLINP